MEKANPIITAMAAIGLLLVLVAIGSVIVPIFGWNPWGSAQALFCGVGVSALLGAVLLMVALLGTEGASRQAPGPMYRTKDE